MKTVFGGEEPVDYPHNEPSYGHYFHTTFGLTTLRGES